MASIVESFRCSGVLLDSAERLNAHAGSFKLHFKYSYSLYSVMLSIQMSAGPGESQNLQP